MNLGSNSSASMPTTTKKNPHRRRQCRCHECQKKKLQKQEPHRIRSITVSEMLLALFQCFVIFIALLLIILAINNVSNFFQYFILPFIPVVSFFSVLPILMIAN